jgi:hypothetical protein
MKTREHENTRIGKYEMLDTRFLPDKILMLIIYPPSQKNLASEAAIMNIDASSIHLLINVQSA